MTLTWPFCPAPKRLRAICAHRKRLAHSAWRQRRRSATGAPEACATKKGTEEGELVGYYHSIPLDVSGLLDMIGYYCLILLKILNLMMIAGDCGIPSDHHYIDIVRSSSVIIQDCSGACKVYVYIYIIIYIYISQLLAYVSIKPLGERLDTAFRVGCFFIPKSQRDLQITIKKLEKILS